MASMMRKLSRGTRWGEGAAMGRGGYCYFRKVVREGLTEKVTFEKILGGNEGASHWISGR